MAISTALFRRGAMRAVCIKPSSRKRRKRGTVWCDKKPKSRAACWVFCINGPRMCLVVAACFFPIHGAGTVFFGGVGKNYGPKQGRPQGRRWLPAPNWAAWRARRRQLKTPGLCATIIWPPQGRDCRNAPFSNQARREPFPKRPARTASKLFIQISNAAGVGKKRVPLIAGRGRTEKVSFVTGQGA